MKIYDLSGHPSLPCFILKHGGSTIMLDCGLDVTSTLCYLPMSVTPNEMKKDVNNLPKSIKEIDGMHFIDDEPKFIVPEMDLFDMANIDVILVSNFNCALALPYVTEYTSFRGVVYATEPTLNFTKLLMEELVENIRKVPRLDKQSTSSSISSSSRMKGMKDPEIMGLFSSRFGDSNSIKDWQRLFNAFDVKSCISKFHILGLNEIKEIPGGLQIQSLSSGFTIGSCNWLITSPYHKFGYVSSSSVLMTHAKPMETTPLKSCDILILSCLSQRPLSNPDSHIKEFCATASMTLKNGGNVLVPCCVVGALYDLIECLHKHLELTGQGATPLYCLSPVANSSLAYSNIYSEWLSTTKQSKALLPDYPFPHAEFLRIQRLQAFTQSYEGFSKDASHPCVVFASHTSLRFGDASQLMHTWNKIPLNSVIITDPSLNYNDILAPFKPLIMGVYHCPVDTSMSFYEANNFIREVAPKKLLVPERYLMSNKPATFIDPEFNPIPTGRLEVTKLSMKKNFKKVAMTPELAQSLTPTEIQPGLVVATVAGSLTSRDSKFTLKPISLTTSTKPTKNGNILKPKLAFGQLNILEFNRRLRQKNLSTRVEDLGSGNFMIELPDDDALLQVENGCTHVICNNQKIRVIIRDTLLECLSKLT